MYFTIFYTYIRLNLSHSLFFKVYLYYINIHQLKNIYIKKVINNVRVRSIITKKSIKNKKNKKKIKTTYITTQVKRIICTSVREQKKRNIDQIIAFIRRY